MTPRETSWRLRLREVGADGGPGGVVGTGFAVTDHAALTCAHVVEDVTDCWVEPLDGSVKAQHCRIQAKPPTIDMTDGSSDIAVISVPNPVIPAPLGPYEPPASGTEIEVVGYIERYLDWGRTQVTRGHILGDSVKGLIQVGILDGHPPIVEGYSGGAAVDVHSGRVVGMVAQVEPDHQIAWLIPLAAIADRWPPLAEYLPKGLQGDPDFRRAYNEFRHGHYEDALRGFGEVAKSYPYEADIHYYRVLAALNGQRPGGYHGAVIEKIEQLLDYALRLRPGAAHIQALLALVEEDYYKLRGLKPKVKREFPDIRDISPVHAWEIVTNVAARECGTWQYLNQSINRGSL
jgi:S1-C subfamily serine protease